MSCEFYDILIFTKTSCTSSKILMPIIDEMGINYYRLNLNTYGTLDLNDKEYKKERHILKCILEIALSNPKVTIDDLIATRSEPFQNIADRYLDMTFSEFFEYALDNPRIIRTPLIVNNHGGVFSGISRELTKHDYCCRSLVVV